MPDRPELSEDKRALLERYLRGDAPKTATTRSAISEHTQAAPESQPDTSSRASLVTVQSGGSRRPFFYVHVHWAGGAFYTIPLAHSLGSDQPFYVLEPYQFDGLRVPPTMEIMAADYIKLVRAVQPEGPYLLGGFCGGAIIAFEMARQLHAEGQTVDALVLIEAVDGPAPHRMIIRRCVGGFIRRVCSLFGLDPGEQFNFFLRLRHIYLLLRYPRYRKAQGFSRFPTIDELRRDWIGIFVWIISKYVTCQYWGKATNLWARDRLGRVRAWIGKVANAEAKEVENLVIPGTHTTCRTTHLSDLAEHLKVYLNEAEAGRGQSVPTGGKAV